MNFINVIKNNISRWRVHRKKGHYAITPKGDCIARYIIDKYLNHTKEDEYIQAYEDHITDKEEAVRQLPRYMAACIDKNGKEKEGVVHFLAAVFSLQLILYSINNSNYYYNLIIDEETRLHIKTLVDQM